MWARLSKRSLKDKGMVKEIVIDGIMRFECDHAYLYWFMNIDGVGRCKVNTKTRTVTAKLKKPVADEEFYKALENKGYKIISIKDVK